MERTRIGADGDHEQVIAEALAARGDLRGALLPVLNAIHDRLGYLPSQTVERVAVGLNLSRAEVHGVITFYHDYRTTPPGRHVLKLCRAEACQSMGANDLVAHMSDRHGLELHATAPDGSITLEPVFCLGNCACAPAAMIDGRLVGRVTAATLDALVRDPEAEP
jgi:formate dehydrogenase subunit gamma